MKVKTVLLAAACAALLSAPSAFSALTFTLEQVGSDVVLTGSGSANLLDLTQFDEDAPANGGVAPDSGSFLSGSGSADLYTNVSFVPFGSGNTTFQSSGSGLPIGINLVAIIPPTTALAVPAGYVSGDPIALSTSTFANTDLQTLGVTPGTYTWNWGSGANADSATLTVIPEPATYAALFAVAALGLAVWRKRVTK